MASPADLTSLAAVKAWLGLTSTDDDMLLARLITGVSTVIGNALNRSSILPAAVTDVLDGANQTGILLRNWPVIAITSLTIEGQPVAAAPLAGPGISIAPGPGYALQPPDADPSGSMQMLSLRGTRFWRGRQNVVVSYVAGYQVMAEVAQVPAAAPFLVQAAAPYGDWGSDRGVAYFGGAALAPVQGPPAQGQYAVSAGLYTFSAADAGQPVALSYGYVPADLGTAAMEWVAERYRYRDRIGMTSKSLGGQETAAYRVGAVPDFVGAIVASYKRVVPC